MYVYMCIYVCEYVCMCAGVHTLGTNCLQYIKEIGRGGGVSPPKPPRVFHIHVYVSLKPRRSVFTCILHSGKCGHVNVAGYQILYRVDSVGAMYSVSSELSIVEVKQTPNAYNAWEYKKG